MPVCSGLFFYGAVREHAKIAARRAAVWRQERFGINFAYISLPSIRRFNWTGLEGSSIMSTERLGHLTVWKDEDDKHNRRNK